MSGINVKQKRILGCACILLAIAAVLWGLGGLVQGKSANNKYHDFFAQQEDFDVLFFGTSHMLNGVFPMELWQDHGIVSYNFGGHANKMPVTYWTVKNALVHTKPKLVVVDTYDISSQEKTFSRLEFVHYTFDAFPLTLTKCRAVLDLLDDPAIAQEMADGQIFAGEKRVPMGLLWNFSVYHPRWAELDQSDFEPLPTVEKGAESRIAVTAPHAIKKVPSQDMLEGETTGIRYLRRLIEDCRQDDVEVLLIYLPFQAEADQQREANRISAIADEYGINSINFLDTNVVDYDTDLYDTEGHLNPSGARKLTDFLGQYITEHYDIPDQRQNPAYKGWYEDYDVYAGFKDDRLKSQEQLDAYLMLLADKNYSFVFYLDDPAPMLADAGYTALLENLGIDTAQLAAGEGCLITRPGGQKAQVWPVPANGAGRWNTALGLVELQNGAITLDGETCLAAPAAENSSALRAAVLSGPEHRVVDAADFDFSARAVSRPNAQNDLP